MSEISQLSPQILWQFFDTICSIPHPSKHEDKLVQYIINWAKERNLPVVRDDVGNVIIKKPATESMTDRKTVVLQAHLDMVTQKNEETKHDFLTDPIRPYIDGDWVTATETTLGADNGIGASACLAVLASTDIEHGPLEVLLTIDEEAGMTGAFGLKEGWLEADILINTDSEQEGEVYMGCAGGVDSTLQFDVAYEALPTGFVGKRLEIKGLRGGHSGCDIHTGRANANKLLGRFLADYGEKLGLRVVAINGGTLRNAIPREAHVELAIPTGNIDHFQEQTAQFLAVLQEELGLVETSIQVLSKDIELPEKVLPQPLQNKIIATINACPNGVIRMSDAINGVVETSLNLGVITTNEDKMILRCLIRSLSDSGRHSVETMLSSLAHLAQANIEFSGAYPGWKPDPDSEIMKIFRQTYQDIYGRIPNIMVIHAGLECGLFKKPYPEMDMISFGPTIRYPHSPDEKVEIATVGLFWEQLVALLKAIPKK